MNVVTTRDVEDDKQGDMTYVLEFTTEDGNQQLHPGDFVHLAPRALHSLKAVEHASLLVTICLRPG